MTDLSDEAIRAYAANIFDLEDARETAQSDLKDAWAHIREAHGKRFADSLKLAVKRARQDADKRAAADEVDAEAERIMAILSAPRATRTIASRVPEHDAETGEVIEHQISQRGHNAGANTGGKDETRSDRSHFVNQDRRHQSESGAHDGHAADASELQRPQQVETNHEPAEGSAEETSAPIRRMSMTPLEPREAGGLKGFGFTVRFDEPQPAMAAQTVTATMPVVNAPAGRVPVESPADHSQPNPICRDPDDCGVYASWQHPCLSCVRAAERAA